MKLILALRPGMLKKYAYAFLTAKGCVCDIIICEGCKPVLFEVSQDAIAFSDL